MTDIQALLTGRYLRSIRQSNKVISPINNQRSLINYLLYCYIPTEKSPYGQQILMKIDKGEHHCIHPHKEPLLQLTQTAK